MGWDFAIICKPHETSVDEDGEIVPMLVGLSSMADEYYRRIFVGSLHELLLSKLAPVSTLSRSIALSPLKLAAMAVKTSQLHCFAPAKRALRREFDLEKTEVAKAVFSSSLAVSSLLFHLALLPRRIQSHFPTHLWAACCFASTHFHLSWTRLRY